jgi:antitoxin component YwqK of YwqJK toxin-antitoxin module
MLSGEITDFRIGSWREWYKLGSPHTEKMFKGGQEHGEHVMTGQIWNN